MRSDAKNWEVEKITSARLWLAAIQGQGLYSVFGRFEVSSFSIHPTKRIRDKQKISKFLKNRNGESVCDGAAADRSE
ncbi:hypothetical protein I3760_09G189300 [Carya illinoinensis]|nr:hypothetical protein I3760_09G189300 [Carya illinoinensis]